MSKKSNAWVIELLALAAIWGSSFLFMRVGAADFGAIAIAFLRCAIAGVVLLPWLVAIGRLSELRKHWLKVFAVGVVNCAIPFSLFAYAVMHITTGLASVLNAAAPLFAAAIAWVWLKDRLSGSRVVGLFVGLVGVAMLASGKASFKGGAGDATWAIAACIAATVCYGLVSCYTKRYLGEIHSSVTATGTQIGSTLALAIPAALTWPETNPSTQSWAAIAFLGIICTAIAYILYFRLMTSVGPAKALSVTFLIPVFGMFYGAVFLAEAVTNWMIICAAVIVAGTALATGVVRFSRR